MEYRVLDAAFHTQWSSRFFGDGGGVAASRTNPAAVGPGTELKKLLARIGITATPACSCNRMAARMDALGPDGSEAILDEVLAVMRQEAKRRGLPWSEAVGLLLVKWAIRRARRAS
jgi:hypothetical protein